LALLVRSTTELAFGVIGQKSPAARQDSRFGRSIAFGVLTILYLALMCKAATVDSDGFDPDGPEADKIRCYIHHRILCILERESNNGHKTSPHLDVVMEEITRNIDDVVTSGPCSGLEMEMPRRREVAKSHLDKLRRDLPDLNPREAINYGSRAPSGQSSIFDRLSVFSGGRSSAGRSSAGPSSVWGSDPDMRRTYRRASPSGPPPGRARRVTPTHLSPMPEDRY
jgi:hypothetical protein